VRVKQVFEHYPRQRHPAREYKFCPFCGTSLAMTENDRQEQPAYASCGFVQRHNPAPTVSVLVVDGERVILGKRRGHPGRGTWSLPSGSIEYVDADHARFTGRK
jgi:NADH pyrophosphatase NudC (nudix superfamily)